MRLGQLERLDPGDGQLKDTAWLSPAEAAGFYARNRRYLNLEVMGERERQLMQTLDQAFGRVDGLKGRDASGSNACGGGGSHIRIAIPPGGVLTPQQ